MKLKGMKGIALVGLVALLVMVPVAAAAGGGEVDVGEYNWDARYWWEVSWDGYPLTPCQREQIGEITAMILDRYFGIEDTFVMSPDEFEKATRPLVGHEKEWEALRLFGYYAQKRGFEVPAAVFVVPSGFETPPGIPAPVIPPVIPGIPPPIEPEPYWWEVLDPQRQMAAIRAQIAEAKGISPDEAEKRFGDLFPGVDLWNMTLYEFDNFLGGLPRPPVRRLLCLEEVKQRPRIIAVFGGIPPLSTEYEIREHEEKLQKVVSELIPVLRELGCCKFPFGAIVVSRGAISISVRSDRLPIAEKIYEMIAEKAESLFGFGREEVAVTFSDGRGGGPGGGCRFSPRVSPPAGLPCDWRPPFNQRHRPILGGVKVTAGRYSWCNTTSSFAVQRRVWWWYDEDYIVTGHKGPRLTPVGMRIYQPTIADTNEAGTVGQTTGMRAHADASRVRISDAKVRPNVLIAGVTGAPLLLCVVASGDALEGVDVWMAAGRSGAMLRKLTQIYTDVILGPGWYREKLYNQLLVLPREAWPIDGDSGSPVFSITAPNEIKIHGLHAGTEYVHGTRFIIISPVSGVEREFPGWRVWTK